MNTVDLIASLIKSGHHEAAVQAVNELVETTCALEADSEEMRARIAELGEEIADLTARADQVDAWEGRYNALLEEAEASRPREIDGGEVSRGATRGTIVVDCEGFPWVSLDGGWWQLARDWAIGKRSELRPLLAPYTIVWTPKENTNE